MESVLRSIDLAPLFHPDTIRLSRLAERLDDGPHHGGRIEPLALVITQREEATGQAGIDRYPMLQLAVGRAGMQVGQVDLGQLHPPVRSYLECRFHILKIVNLRHISIIFRRNNSPEITLSHPKRQSPHALPYLCINIKKQHIMIRYKKYQNKNEKNVTTFNKWYARAVCEETVDIAALAEHMSTHNTPFSTGAIHGMLKDMVNCIKELLMDGKNVKIDDLGIFSVGIRSKGAVTPEDFSTQGNIIGVRLRARATGNLSSASLKLTAKLREYTEYSNGEVTPGGSGGDSESPDEI